MADDKSVAYSQALIALFKGVVNRETHSKQWETILSQRTKVEDYISKIGLTLCLDENDGYCYLRQSNSKEDEPEIPRLIPRHQLSYPVSLLLLLLRKQLLDFDTKNSDERLVVSKQDIIDKILLFLKDTSNEAKQIKEIEGYIRRVEDFGFIRRLKGSDEQYEVLRIIRSFIDVPWLNELDQRLEQYKAYALSNSDQGGVLDESL